MSGGRAHRRKQREQAAGQDVSVPSFAELASSYGANLPPLDPEAAGATAVPTSYALGRIVTGDAFVSWQRGLVKTASARDFIFMPHPYRPRLTYASAQDCCRIFGTGALRAEADAYLAQLYEQGVIDSEGGRNPLTVPHSSPVITGRPGSRQYKVRVRLPFLAVGEEHIRLREHLLDVEEPRAFPTLELGVLQGVASKQLDQARSTLFKLKYLWPGEFTLLEVGFFENAPEPEYEASLAE